MPFPGRAHWVRQPSSWRVRAKMSATAASGVYDEELDFPLDEYD